MTYSNVDPDEIAKFEALASRWWDENSEFKPLHDINPLRASWIDQFSEVRGKKLIDVGCGGGLLSEAMAHRGATVTGIDMGEAPLSVAKIHLLESKLDIEYRQTTAETIAEERPTTYDVVTCLEMLEHVPDPSKVIQACADVAKPGADLYFSTINRNPKAWLFAIVGAEYVRHSGTAKALANGALLSDGSFPPPPLVASIAPWRWSPSAPLKFGLKYIFA